MLAAAKSRPVSYTPEIALAATGKEWRKGGGEPFAALSPRSAHSPQSTAGSNPRWPSAVAGRNTQVWTPATPAAITTRCVVK